MTSSIEIADTLRTKVLKTPELAALLGEKFDIVGADRTRLLRIEDAFDFLRNNLPPSSLKI